MSFPIFAKLSFNAPGVKENIDKVKDSFESLKTTAEKVGKSIDGMAQAAKMISVATLPIAAASVLATKSFMEFEQQMSKVKALTDGVTNDEFAAMTAEAKRLGAATSFSAKQAAEGLELLAQSGFTAKEQVGLLEPVLRLAEAGSVGLAEASEISTAILAGMGPVLDKTKDKVGNLTSLVDKLAFVSAKSNAGVLDLGEAVKYGGSSLAGFGIPLNEVLASFGLLANAGEKGSSGGTALMNMFNQLLTPTKKGAQMMDELGISLTDTTGKILPMPDLIRNLTDGLNKIKNPSQRSAAQIELFGIRGIRAFNALANAGPQAIQDLMTGLDNAQGSAAAQAKERLNNLAGAFEEFKGATEGILIEVGALFADVIKGPVQGVTSMLSGVAQAFQLATGQVQRNSKAGEAFFAQFGEEKGNALIENVQGFIQGFKEAKNLILDTAHSWMNFFSEAFGGMKLTNKEVGSLIAKIVVFGTVAAPVFAGIAIALMAIGPMVTGVVSTFSFLKFAFLGLGKVISVVLSPLRYFIHLFQFVAMYFGAKAAIITAAIGGAFIALGAGIIGVIRRFDEIKAAFSQGFVPGMMEIAKSFVAGIVDVFKIPFTWIMNTFSGIAKIARLIPGMSPSRPAEPLSPAAAMASTKLVDSINPLNTMNQQGVSLVQPESGLAAANAANDSAIQHGAVQAQSPILAMAQQANAQQANQTIVVKSEVKLDGQVVARSVGGSQVEMAERRGQSISPGEKAMMVRKGATALMKAGGL
jgi:TP901 family phage tail tape measure protein